MKKTILTALGISALTIPALAVYSVGNADAFAGWGDGEHRSERMMKRAEKMFSHFDTDADGAVSIEEFQTLTLERFTMMDANKDGLVTLEEAGNGMKEMRKKWKRGHNNDGDHS